MKGSKLKSKKRKWGGWEMGNERKLGVRPVEWKCCQPLLSRLRNPFELIPGKCVPLGVLLLLIPYVQHQTSKIRLCFYNFFSKELKRCIVVYFITSIL